MEIICKFEIGTGYNNRDVYRIIESSHPKYYVGRTLDFGFMELATKDGCKIVLLP